MVSTAEQVFNILGCCFQFRLTIIIGNLQHEQYMLENGTYQGFIIGTFLMIIVGKFAKRGPIFNNALG